MVKMTSSELLSIMASGMATIAGGTLAVFISMGVHIFISIFCKSLPTFIPLNLSMLHDIYPDFYVQLLTHNPFVGHQSQ